MNLQRNFESIFKGKVITGLLKGIHHSYVFTTKYLSFDIDEIRIKIGTRVDKTNGFYEAEIEFWDGTNWITKTETKTINNIETQVTVKNGFYPDNWTEKQLMEELAYARSKVKTSDWQYPPVGSKDGSNTYFGSLTNGQQVILYIGQRVPARPAAVGIFTPSIFPIF